MINLVTGGAGFVGSHLVNKLMEAGEEVICLDNYITGRKKNIAKWIGNPSFELIRHDVTEPIKLEVNRIWHLACPASPFHYQNNPIKTSKTSFLGTYNMLGLANRVGARFLLSSTSEIYGDPEIHPQPESYKGSVNTIGIRSCYDEGKRVAETLCSDYKRIHNLDIRIARIFNTYGPNMSPNDGRVITNFIIQALKGEPLTVYGEGKQTRSFCYIDDLVSGLTKLMNSEYSLPINIGNPEEYTIYEIAKIIRNKINPSLEIVYKDLPKDDPFKRKPLIDLAKEKLNWSPEVGISEGLNRTISFLKDNL